MPRDIPQFFLNATELVNTPPVYLFEVLLSQRTYRWCSFGDTANVINTTWERCDLRVTGPSQRSGSTLTATASVPFNTSPTLLSDITSVRPQDRVANLYLSYFYQETYQQPVLLLGGRVDDTPLSPGSGDQSARVSFKVVNSGNRQSTTPFIRLRPPTVRYSTPVGTQIVWGTEKIEIV